MVPQAGPADAAGRARAGLRGRLVVTALVAATGLGLAHRYLGGVVGPGVADRWAVLAGAVAAGELALAWLLLGRHRTGTGILAPTFGVATGLTLLRGLLIAAVAGFLVAVPLSDPTVWLAGGLYAVAVTLDAVDGLVARRNGRVTPFGERLDLEFDALAIAVGALLGVMVGALPQWYVLAGGARYAYAGSLCFRRLRGFPVFSLPPSMVRRPLAALQMAVVAIALFPPIDPPATTWLATAALVPFLLGFVRDWLAVSGRLGSRDEVSPARVQDSRW